MEPLRVEEATRLEFYRDFYEKKSVAWMDNYGQDDKGYYVVLSSTIFYPHGGGQKGDRGKITIPNDVAKKIPFNELTVIDTRKDMRGKELFVRHYIKESLEGLDMDVLMLGNEYGLEIDWNFRRTQMRLHAVAHIFHFFIEQEVGKKIPYPKISDLSEDSGLNSYGEKAMIGEDKFSIAIEKFNKWSQEGYVIETYSDKEKGESFRWWECEQWKVPCGGTHLNSTKEIGQITATLSLKKKSTNMVFELVG